MEKFDIFTKEEKKLYAFFMNKKPGKTLAERIEFASFVSELITDLRGCTPEEKSFFDRFFGDFKKKNKDPDVLLRYAFRLENLILRSRAKGTVFNPETLFSDEEVTEPQNYDE
jgi:hypothetical protein